MTTAASPTASIATASAGSVGPLPPSTPITVQPSACFGLRTAGYVINKALLLTMVQGADSAWESDEYEDALDALNDYMASLEGQGIRLGYRRVCNISDIVTVSDGAIRGIIASLAIELSSQFGSTVSPALFKQAKEGMRAIRREAIRSGVTRYPNTLPRGSGSEGWYGSGFSHYYNSSPFATISMSANRRETEISVAAGAEKAQGIWQTLRFSGLEVDVSGRIRNTGPRVSVPVNAQFTLSSPSEILTGLVGFSKNGWMDIYVTTPINVTPVSVTLAGTITLESGEFLDVVVANAETTVNITLSDAVVRLG